MNSKFETNFPLQHQQKDLRLAIDMADSVDQPMYVISSANEVWIATPFPLWNLSKPFISWEVNLRRILIQWTPMIRDFHENDILRGRFVKNFSFTVGPLCALNFAIKLTSWSQWRSDFKGIDCQVIYRLCAAIAPQCFVFHFVDCVWKIATELPSKWKFQAFGVYS